MLPHRAPPPTSRRFAWWRFGAEAFPAGATCGLPPRPGPRLNACGEVEGELFAGRVAEVPGEVVGGVFVVVEGVALWSLEWVGPDRRDDPGHAVDHGDGPDGAMEGDKAVSSSTRYPSNVWCVRLWTE